MKQLYFPIFLTFFLLTSSIQAQWTEMNTAPTETLELFTFVDDDLGYALQTKTGGYHKGVKTIDGGATWTSFNLPSANKSYLEMHFFEEDKGVIVYRDLNNVNTPTIIYLTVDGGANWQDISPTATVAGYGTADVQFIDENIGFMAVGQVFYRTINGGTTWSKKDISLSQPSYYGIQAMHFYDANNGVMGLFDGTFAYLGGTMSTSDGGVTWTESYQTKGGTSTGRVVQASANVAYAASCKGGYGYLEIYKTVNSGIFWDTIFLPDTTNGTIKDFDFKNELEGAAIVTSGTSNVDYIFSTLDGGQNWLLNATMPAIQDYDFELTTNTGYLTGAYGKYYKQTGLLKVDKHQKQQLRLFPNPAVSNSVIQWGTDIEMKSIQIIDITGKTLLSTQVNNHQLKLENLPNGSYIIKLTSINNEVFVKKMIIDSSQY